VSLTTNLHLEFVDEALRLARDAGAQGIHLRILGSIAYRIQCPNHIHLFEQMARVLTDSISAPTVARTRRSASFS
jgi:hypothetical protein